MVNSTLLSFRVNARERQALEQAARSAGKTLSEWLRGLVLEKVTTEPASTQYRMPTPVEIAEGFALGGGAGTGGHAPKDEPAIGKLAAKWLPLWLELLRKRATDPAQFDREMARLAPGFKPKEMFWKLKPEAQAAALDQRFPLGEGAGTGGGNPLTRSTPTP